MGVAGWRFVHTRRTPRVRAVIMSKPPEGGEAGQQRQPAQQRQVCSKCGCIARYMPALETLNGTNYRLVRCAICRSLTWFEEPRS